MSQAIVFCSIIAILLCNLLIDEGNLWPSALTLLPVAATALILAMNMTNPIFDNKFTKFFGDISYSLYLWHWIWFVLFRNFGYLSDVNTFYMIALSIAFAWLSYKFIEKNRAISNLRVTVGVFLFVVVSAAFLIKQPSNPITNAISIYRLESFKIAKFETYYIQNKKQKQFNSCRCFLSKEDYDYDKCLQIAPDKKNILLLGDSHSAQYSSTLRNKSTFNILEASASYVFPFPNPRGMIHAEKLMKFIFDNFIPENKSKIDLVIVSANWLMRTNANMRYSLDEEERGIKELV